MVQLSDWSPPSLASVCVGGQPSTAKACASERQGVPYALSHACIAHIIPIYVYSQVAIDIKVVPNVSFI